MGIWTPQSNKGIMMYNISFVDFGVTDEPVEVDETWTKTMYICLFLGGFLVRYCHLRHVAGYSHTL